MLQGNSIEPNSDRKKNRKSKFQHFIISFDMSSILNTSSASTTFCTLAQMWVLIEDGLGVQIPTYLKNITRLCGFDTPLALAKLSSLDMQDFELFARTEMKFFIPSNESSYDYYEKYHVCIHRFVISRGHKLLLEEVQKFVYAKLCTNKYYFTIDHPKYHPQKRQEETIVDETTPQKSLQKFTLEHQIITEHDSLYHPIKSWLEKQIEIKKEVLDCFSPSSVEICVEEETNSESSSNFSGKIICPICHNKCKAHKMEYGKSGKKRWIRANFERHVKAHFRNQVVTPVRQSSRQNSTETIPDYLLNKSTEMGIATFSKCSKNEPGSSQSFNFNTARGIEYDNENFEENFVKGELVSNSGDEEYAEIDLDDVNETDNTEDDIVSNSKRRKQNE